MALQVLASQLQIMPEFFLCEVIHNSPEYTATVALRHEILRAPIDLEFPSEELSAENAHFHLACYYNDELAACLVLVPIDEREIKMRQVAVKENFQRRGVGRVLVEFSEQFARERGFVVMTLHARQNAVAFYEKLGYKKCGEAFEEVTLIHWKTWKNL